MANDPTDGAHHLRTVHERWVNLSQVARVELVFWKDRHPTRPEPWLHGRQAHEGKGFDLLAKQMKMRTFEKAKHGT